MEFYKNILFQLLFICFSVSANNNEEASKAADEGQLLLDELESFDRPKESVPTSPISNGRQEVESPSRGSPRKQSASPRKGPSQTNGSPRKQQSVTSSPSTAKDSKPQKLNRFQFQEVRPTINL
jgi:hypothetical protein